MLLALVALSCAASTGCGARSGLFPSPPADAELSADSRSPGTCTRNDQCPRLKGRPFGFCYLGAACRAPGRCWSPVFTCHFEDPPACGCDGNTYQGWCRAGEEGISIAYFGRCGSRRCFELHLAYLSAVEDAKKCCPSCGGSQCTRRVASTLGCPCEVAVDASNSEALARVSSAAAQAAAEGCQFDKTCGEIAGRPAVDGGGLLPYTCPSQPPPGRCSGTGSSGSCE